jgi:hypothetical protein
MPDTLYIPLHLTGRYQTILVENDEGLDIVTTDLETVLIDTEGKVVVSPKRNEE